MKLYAVTVLFKAAGAKIKKLSAAYDLSSFGFFQRSSVQEFMDFTSKILVEKTGEGQRTSVGEKGGTTSFFENDQIQLCLMSSAYTPNIVKFEYMCHVYVRTDGLSTVLISDQEYPQRVAFNLLNKVLEDYVAVHPSSEWPAAKENGLQYAELSEFLRKYQNPSSGDALTKLQDDVDETKIVLHRTLEAVLDRGERLDDLVGKSEELSLHSKAFYTTAKKTNSCCILL